MPREPNTIMAEKMDRAIGEKMNRRIMVSKPSLQHPANLVNKQTRAKRYVYH